MQAGPASAASKRQYPIVSDQVSGIVRVDRLTSKKGDFQFILFSDVHVPIGENACSGCVDESCPDFFINVLEQVIHSTEKPVDFYIELDIFDENMWRQKTYWDTNITLAKTWKHFEKCYTSQDKSACRQQWPNLRYHYADIRTDPRTKSGLGYVMYEHKGSKVYGSQFEEWAEEIKSSKISSSESFYRFIEQIDKKLDSNFEQKFIQEFINSYRMSKQIKNAPSPFIKRNLIEFIADEFHAAYYLLRQTITFYNSSELEGVSLKDVLTNIYSALTNVTKTLMDAYLLSRVLRVFKTPEIERQNRVIIYAGRAHIDTYISFMTDVLKFNHESFDTTDDKQFCVKLPTKEILRFTN